MRPLEDLRVGDILDEDQDPDVPAGLAFAVLFWKARDGGRSGIVAAFENREDAHDWASATAHSDLHTDTCDRVYIVAERRTRKVTAVERCRGGSCRCGPDRLAP